MILLMALFVPGNCQTLNDYCNFCVLQSMWYFLCVHLIDDVMMALFLFVKAILSVTINFHFADSFALKTKKKMSKYPPHLNRTQLKTLIHTQHDLGITLKHSSSFIVFQFFYETYGLWQKPRRRKNYWILFVFDFAFKLSTEKKELIKHSRSRSKGFVENPDF